MTPTFSTPRNAIAFIALYVTVSLVFIVQRTSAWIDADSRQGTARQELRVLMRHSFAKAPVAAAERTDGFTAESETRAIAEFDALLRKTISALGGVVVSTQSEQSNDAPRKNSITMSAIFQGNIDVVQAALYKLETGTPAILIDKISIDPQDPGTSSNNPLLRVSLSMSSRWNMTR